MIRYLPVAVILAVALIGVPDTAHAAGAGGGSLPWDQPLTTLKTDLTGPTAFVISLIAFAVAGITYAFSHEVGQFMRTMLIVIMVASSLAAVVQLATALGIAGAVV